MTSIASTENSCYEGIEMLKEILHGVTVPAFSNDSIVEQTVDVDRCQPSLQMVDMPVLEMMGSHLYPFLMACNGDLRRAAIRIVQTCSWRCSFLLPMLKSIDEATVQSEDQIEFMKAHGFKKFPQDLIQDIQRELKLGRLFHEGYDQDGDPIIYFIMNPSNSIHLNMDAIENTALHIVECSLQKASSMRPVSDGSWIRCTVIIILEQGSKAEPKASYWESTAFFPLRYLTLLQRLVPLFSRHYPERLKHVLIIQAPSESVVTPTGNSKSWWGNLLGNIGAFAYVPSARTRNKIHIITDFSDISRYVSLNALLPELKSSTKEH